MTQSAEPFGEQDRRTLRDLARQVAEIAADPIMKKRVELWTKHASLGYTDELPEDDWSEGDKVRLKDIWGLSESQETVGVSPDMFREFVFPYQLPVIEKFGLSYYGCCEPVHVRWDIIEQIPNLRRVSVSPWCDQEVMADALGQDYIFCRKPNPAIISTENWNEDAIRTDHQT